MSDAVSWTEFREFRGIDLEASFLLSATLLGDMLKLELDLVLTPEHALYEKPRPAQKACVRAGIVEFPYLDRLAVDDQAILTETAVSALASLEPGRISALSVAGEGSYLLSGEFGTVAFESGRPVLHILSH